ncbi:hypothetical protein GCWU000324_01481 [Kingella oralis ATCC 51147]|uniref:Uncharacterized protein n=1 Tax=Kingella oralis ATCC 51147 TaxID=629741 RepID=C4GKH8_9NEIS|nr:hypothetical protein GCWU000324_01481 [Kingella oralis ATCC 51147]
MRIRHANRLHQYQQSQPPRIIISPQTTYPIPPQNAKNFPIAPPPFKLPPSITSIRSHP